MMTTKQEVLLGAIVYSNIFSIPKSDPTGKRSRKKISQAIRKQLSTFAKGREVEYVELVNKSHTVIDGVIELINERHGGLFKVEPGTLINGIRFKRPDLYESFDVQWDDVQTLIDAYEESGLQLSTMRYVTALLDVITKVVDE